MWVKRFRSVILMGLFLTVGNYILAQHSSSRNVAIVYHLRQSELCVGQPVILDFTVRNDSDSPLRLDLGQDHKGSFLFKLIEPDGQTVVLPTYSHEGISQSGAVYIETGQSFSEGLILDEWYGFGHTGDYRIGAKLATPIVDDRGKSMLDEQFSWLHFSISSRDPAKLQSLSARLLAHILRASSYSEAAEAATELSYVRDSVAVPYLNKALMSGKLVEPLAVAGLERIGDLRAVEALIEDMRTGPPNTQTLAHGALQRICSATSDPNLRKMIEQSLVGPS